MEKVACSQLITSVLFTRGCTSCQSAVNQYLDNQQADNPCLSTARFSQEQCDEDPVPRVHGSSWTVMLDPEGNEFCIGEKCVALPLRAPPAGVRRHCSTIDRCALWDTCISPEARW